MIQHGSQEYNLSAVLRRRLADVSQSDGAVSLEYLRGHVQSLGEALAKAKQIGLKDEVLLDSAGAELESLMLILVHATFMQNCINNSPLKGGGGTDAEITSALSTANSAIERAIELGMFGVVAVADGLWNLLVQLDQVNTHIATLRECIEQIRLTSANAAEQVDYGKFSPSNFIEDIAHEATDSDNVGDPNELTTQDTNPLPPTPEKPTEMKPLASVHVNARPDERGRHRRSYSDFDFGYDYDSDDNDDNDFAFHESDDEYCHSDNDDDERDFQDVVHEYYYFQDLLDDIMQGVASSSELPDDVQRHVAKAAAMLDVHADDLLDDGSHPELYRCVEKLRSALVRAEELGMVEADLIVVAASTELLRRFPSVCDIIDSNGMPSVIFRDVSKSEILPHYWNTKHDNFQALNMCNK